MNIFWGNDSQKEPEVPDERHYPASGAGLAGHPKNRNFAGPDPESAGPLALTSGFYTSKLSCRSAKKIIKITACPPLALAF